MIKRMYYKVLLCLIPTVFFAVGLLTATKINVYADSQSHLIGNVQYYHLENPSLISGTDNDFFVIDNENYLHQYKNGVVNRINFQLNNATDFEYSTETGKIFAMKSDGLFEINFTTEGEANETSLASLSNGVAVDFEGNYLVYADNTSVTVKTSEDTFIFTEDAYDPYDKCIFTSIKDICILGGNLYLIYATNSTVNLIAIELKSNLSESVFTFKKQISASPSTDYKLDVTSNGIVILSNNTLKFYQVDNSAPITLTTEYNSYERAFKSGEIVNIGGFCATENKIIIADYFSNSVQAFTFANGSMSFDKVLIASSGSDLNRLSNPQSLTTSENCITVADTDNKRLVKTDITTNETTEILLDAKPHFIASTTLNDYYVLATSSGNTTLYHFDNSGNEVRHDAVIGCNTVDMQTNAHNELFLLNNTSKTLCKFNADNAIITVAELDNFDENAKLNFNPNGEIAYILSGSKIKQFNLVSNDYANFIVSETQVIDFCIDYMGNVYLLCKNADDTMKIDKYTNAGTYLASKSIGGQDYTNLEIDLKSATFYLIDSNLCVVDKLSFDNFADNLNNFENDLTFVDAPTTTSGAVVGKVKNDTFAYKYPFTISPICNLNKDAKIIVIDEACEQNSQFAYCLIENANKKLETLYVERKNLDLQPCGVAPSFEKVKIITAFAMIYKMPTTASFENGKKLQAGMAKMGDTFTVVSYDNEYADCNNCKFFEIKLQDNTIAYLQKANAMNADLDKFQETFQPNAHTEKVLSTDDIKLFKQDGENYLPLESSLSAGTKIFVNNYDINNEYTKISYESTDGEQLSAYIQTKFIVLDDILTNHTIIGIVLLLVSIALVIIVSVFITKYLKKRKKEKLINE